MSLHDTIYTVKYNIIFFLLDTSLSYLGPETNIVLDDAEIIPIRGGTGISCYGCNILTEHYSCFAV